MAGVASYTDDMAILGRLKEMIDRSNSTKGRLAKIDIIKSYPELKPILRRIFDPETKTGVTLSGILKYSKDDASKEHKGVTLYSLFDDLVARSITGDSAKATIYALAAKMPEYKNLIFGIMSKDIKLAQISHTTLNIIFPGMFTKFPVMLATPNTESKTDALLEEHKHLNPPAYFSQKKDGIRLITTIRDGKVEFRSRSNREFSSLGVLKAELEAADIKGDWMLDGEVEAFSEDGKENFKDTVSQVKRGVEMKNPRYSIFGMIPLTAVATGRGTENFADELKRMKALPPMTHVIVLDQHPYTAATYAAAKEIAKEQGHEGLMLRINVPWEGKRSKFLIKDKFINSAEFEVKEVVIEPMPFPNGTGGIVTIPAVKNVRIEYKGDPVWVGSGFDADERQHWAKYPEELLGKVITVEYQQEFRDDKTGKMSLRCPIFKVVYGVDRDV